MSSALALFAEGGLDIERARDLLRSTRDIDTILGIRDAAKLAAEYARLRDHGVGAINDAQELVLRAQRRFGEFLRAAELSKGQPRKRNVDAPDITSRPKLADLGVSRDESSRCQKLAAIDELIFEQHIESVRAKGEKITTTGAIAATSDAGDYESDEWYTPERYIESARAVLGGFDLDPASCAFAQNTVRAKRFYTKADDGLSKKWRGRVWMNPPYSKIIASFVAKFIEAHDRGDVPAGIVLVNNCTDTDWCQAMLRRFDACFTNGRIAFVNARGDAVAGTRQGQVFFYAGPDREAFAREFDRHGAVMRGER
jgi:phage N-6-adenine-methyltransferase